MLYIYNIIYIMYFLYSYNIYIYIIYSTYNVYICIIYIYIYITKDSLLKLHAYIIIRHKFDY